WLALLAMLGLFLISLGWHYLLTISLLIVLNVLVLTIILFKIKQLKKNLFFPKTLKKLHYKKS
ncbi:MAG TPA: hypothetical protein VHZ76_00390, partial [Gammaproteobacteria bacterium]|nr:hypothetical protein [Gammaproteobacteria bacterium]